MGRAKATITVDREKLEEARRLTSAASVSATIDRALSVLIHSLRIQGDVAAYAARPPSDEEVALASIAPEWSGLADDADWAAAYAADDEPG